ncbi:MAG TPA: O-antigen ligase family protein [Patescibacteria group bacterium]|nr:O-antigen ligase family protein [Patescibacteria group bacterium]
MTPVLPPDGGRRPAGLLASVLVAAGLCVAISFVLIEAMSMGMKWGLAVVMALGVAGLWALAPDRRLAAVAGVIACIPVGVQYAFWTHGDRYDFVRHGGGAPAEPIVWLVDFPIALLLLLFVADLGFGRRRLPSWTRLDTWIAIFLGLSLLSLVNSTEPGLLACEMLRYLKYFALYWMIRTYADRALYLWMLVGISLAVVCLQGLVAMAQYFLFLQLPVAVGGVSESAFELVGGEVIQRVTGFLGHSNTFAAYLLVPIGMALAVLASRVRWTWRLAVVPPLALAVLALALTFSRNGYLVAGLLVPAITLLAIGTGRLPRLLVPGAAMAALAGVLLVFGFGLDATTLRGWGLVRQGPDSGVLGTIMTRIAYDPGKAAESRLDLMRIAVEMVEAHPVLGIGLNSFEENMTLYDRSGTVNIIQQPVHNVFMLVAAETGLPSAVAFIVIGALLAGCSWRLMRRPEEAMFVAGVVGLVAIAGVGCANLLDVTLRKEPIVGLVTIVAGLVVAMESWDRDAVEAITQENRR